MTLPLRHWVVEKWRSYLRCHPAIFILSYNTKRDNQIIITVYLMTMMKMIIIMMKMMILSTPLSASLCSAQSQIQPNSSLQNCTSLCIVIDAHHCNWLHCTVLHDHATAQISAHLSTSGPTSVELTWAACGSGLELDGEVSGTFCNGQSNNAVWTCGIAVNLCNTMQQHSGILHRNLP